MYLTDIKDLSDNQTIKLYTDLKEGKFFFHLFHQSVKLNVCVLDAIYFIIILFSINSCAFNKAPSGNANPQEITFLCLLVNV